MKAKKVKKRKRKEILEQKMSKEKKWAFMLQREFDYNVLLFFKTNVSSCSSLGYRLKAGFA